MTKNITIIETVAGIEVRNNRETVKVFESVIEAKAFAVKLGKKENKNIIVKTDYFNETIKIA